MTLSCINADDGFHIPDSVRTVVNAERAVLMDLQSGTVFTTNAIGAFIWESLVDGQPPSAIASALCGEHHIASEQALADVLAFVHQLYQRNLILKGGPQIKA
jgi:hypothetical protein